jgi:flagellar basal body-associated protein FliL
MADDENVKEGKGGGLNKFLIIGIVALLLVLILGGISIFVSQTLWNSREKNQVSQSNVELPVKATFDLDEFLVAARNGSGIIKAKFQLGLSNEKFSEFVSKHLGEIRDQIGRILVQKTVEEANLSYADGSLQKLIKTKLNELLKKSMINEGGFFSSGNKGEIVKVYIINFYAK